MEPEIKRMGVEDLRLKEFIDFTCPSTIDVLVAGPNVGNELNLANYHFKSTSVSCDSTCLFSRFDYRDSHGLYCCPAPPLCLHIRLFKSACPYHTTRVARWAIEKLHGWELFIPFHSIPSHAMQYHSNVCLHSAAGLPQLDPPTTWLFIASQRCPTGPVTLDQRHLQLRAHDFESALLRVDGRKERQCAGEPLAIARRQIEIDRRAILCKLDLCPRLVDLLEVETDDHARGCLVEIVAHRLQFFFFCGLAVGIPDLFLLPHVAMSLAGVAAFDLHEFVKLEHSPLATRPTLAAFVEYGYSRMICALLLVS